MFMEKLESARNSYRAIYSSWFVCNCYDFNSIRILLIMRRLNISFFITIYGCVNGFTEIHKEVFRLNEFVRLKAISLCADVANSDLKCFILCELWTLCFEVEQIKKFATETVAFAQYSMGVVYFVLK